MWVNKLVCESSHDSSDFSDLDAINHSDSVKSHKSSAESSLDSALGKSRNLSLSLSLSLSRGALFLATYRRQIIFALSIVIFLVALFLRIGFAYQKSGFHVDESLSVAISTGSWIPKFENGEYFGKELKESVYFDDNSISDLWNDLKELWKNNYGDGAAHPNLYYSLLRAWSFDMKTGDFAWIKARGIGLNLVFFALGFYATFILMRHIFSRDSFLVPLFLATAFWNSASVTNAIFIRPYALQECLLLIFTLNCFVFYKLRFIRAKEAFSKHKFFFARFIFATALLCLSHYFSLVFIAFAFIFLAILSRKNIFLLSVVAICSLVIAQIFYRDYFKFLSGYRAREAQEKMLLGNFWENLQQTFSVGADIINSHFCNIYGFAILCVACGIALFGARKHIAFKMPKYALLKICLNLKAFFAYLKPIAKNTLKPYKKIFIALSILAIFAYIVAFTLITLAKDSTQNANIFLDSITYKDSESPTYTAKIAYKHIIFRAHSKTASNLIIENIAFDNALDSSVISIKNVRNRYIDFSSTQDLNLDTATKPKLGELSYRVDFTPLIKVILRYYIALLTLGFIIAFYIQYAKIAWSEEFKCEVAQDSARESKSNFIFLFGFFIIGVAWFCLIFFVAPFKDLRYVMPIFPFLYFGVLLLFALIKKPFLQGILGIAFVATLFINYNVQYLYKKPFIFTQNPKIPVLVHLPNYAWEQGYFLFAFYDTQKYIIEQDSAKLWDKIKDFDAFYMISETPFSAPNGFKQGVLQVESYGFFYLFEREDIINRQTLKNNADFLLQYRF